METNLNKKIEILIVDDNEVNYELLQELINRNGIQLYWAKNGIEALELVSNHENLSLILMDINMPLMDGITATRKIRELNIKIPIIFQTAYTSAENLKECFNAGGNEFISKPLNLTVLNALLKKYLKNDYN